MPARKTVESEMLTRAQAAEFCGVTAETLRRWYAENRGPRVVKLGTARGSRVRYLRTDLREWMADPIGYTKQVRPENLPRFEPPARGRTGTTHP